MEYQITVSMTVVQTHALGSRAITAPVVSTADASVPSSVRRHPSAMRSVATVTVAACYDDCCV